MSKHTPGPWNLLKRKNNEVKIEHTNRHTKGASSLTIAKVTVCDSWFTEQMANAQLIAATPDLLDALQSVIDFPADFFDRPDSEAVTITLTGWHLKKARAAIAKATGEQQ